MAGLKPFCSRFDTIGKIDPHRLNEVRADDGRPIETIITSNQGARFVFEIGESI